MSHSESRWSHALCEACWEDYQPGRRPVRVTERIHETCCQCGSGTMSGIYVRRDSEGLASCPKRPR